MTQRLRPIETKRLYQHIAGVLQQSIDEGQFKVGSYLPPERDPAEQLGVSRASVREALIALEVHGRVSVRVGAGVQVLDAAHAVARPAPGAAVAASVSVAAPMGGADGTAAPVGPLDLLEARLVVEVQTAALAARHASGDDIATLRRSIDRMVKDHAKTPLRHDGDREFHLGLARASGNAALLFIVSTLWDQRYTPLQDRLESLFSTEGLHTAAVQDHRAILEAVAAHDPAAARRTMRRHLTRVLKTFSRGIEASL